MKIVINRCFGGFSLSADGMLEYAKNKGIKLYPFVDKQPLDFKDQRFESYVGQKVFIIHYATKPLTEDGKYEKDSYFSEIDIERNDPALIKTVQKLKAKTNGQCAELGIVEIPDGTEYVIEEYDGLEHIAEKHKTWS